ncbi:MAG: hypothetical protein BA872_07135 [Desulfobacterales bacterium C00003060]|nr:MAG: hypothetical protein BA872_07135 [Desulfobacterales bacterium C00003060]OEU84535.1 MAG: hypothetical protein BA865_05360 [Desulfobacterales bacterium S5133MH4]
MAAVLASEIVPPVNVCSRKFDMFFPVLYVSEETKDCRELDGERDRVNLPVILFQDLHLSQCEKPDGPFPVNHL